MSRRKKTLYLALIAAGVVALLFDRFVLSPGGPSSAGAATPVVGPTPAMRAVPTGAHGRTTEVPRNAIPQKPFPIGVSPWNPDAGIRDLFVPAGAEEASQLDDADGDSTVGRFADGKRRSGRNSFARKHRLNGLLSREGLGIAVVDGQWMRVGDLLDGCTLFAVEGTSVTFICHDGTALLDVAAASRTLKD